MKLLTKAIRRKLPVLYTQGGKDPILQVKFFTPDSDWTWYAIEFDGEDRFFGLVDGDETELGYFLLSDLEKNVGPLGLHIERDKFFDPTPLSKISPWHVRD